MAGELVEREISMGVGLVDRDIHGSRAGREGVIHCAVGAGREGDIYCDVGAGR